VTEPRARRLDELAGSAGPVAGLHRSLRRRSSGEATPGTAPAAKLGTAGSTPAVGHGRRMSSCRAVAHLGDSTSEGLISPDYLPDPRQRLAAQYARVGATSQRCDISSARSIVETLRGQTNGHVAATQLIDKGFHGCWVIALGDNDTADVYVGSTVSLPTRIARMMSAIGDQPVLWVNVKSLLTSDARIQDRRRPRCATDGPRRTPVLRRTLRETHPHRTAEVATRSRT
jgi:hypothetical protein